VQKAEQLQPDLIILDLSMPVMNGIEAAPHSASNLAIGSGHSIQLLTAESLRKTKQNR